MGVSSNELDELDVDGGDLAVPVLEVTDLIGDELAAELADLVTGPDRGEQLLGLGDGELPWCASGQQGDEVPVDAAHALGAQADELLASLGHQPQCLGAAVDGDLGQVWGVQGDHGDGVGVGVVVLAAVALQVHAHERGTAGRDVHDSFARGKQTLGEVLADAVAAFDRPGPFPPLAAERS